MSSDLFSLKGKVGLITGATNGIGQGMAIGLVEAGIDQLIFTHRPSTDPKASIELFESAAKSKGFNTTITAISVDLSQVATNQVESQIFNPALEASINASVDILVNNAGISHRSPLVDFDDDEFDKVLHVDMRLPAKLTQLMGRHLIALGKKGKILFTASLMSYQGGLNITPYAISKGGLRSFIQACSNEWAKYGINVNGIAPGYIQTNMTTALENDPVRSRQILERIPAERWGRPDDFKGPTVFLCSEASGYIHGELLLVDGGWIGR